MSVQTRSSFYYVDPVILSNRFLDFNEGGPDLVAEVPIGARSPQDLVNAVNAVLNEVGTLTYSVTMDRVTNQVTISANANFDLLVTTGNNAANNAFGLLGFTSDKTGSDSYVGDISFANEFRPQFLLQEYLDPTKWVEAVKATVNESADGTIETFSFGKKSFYQLNIMFITNIEQGVGGPIETDLAAEENAQAFMTFIIDKTPIEFMPDRDDHNTFDKIFLESTVSNGQGLGFKLKQMTNKALDGYYETGTLVFRKLG